jgi:GAF domain-containing protein
MRLEDATRPELLTALRALLEERASMSRRVSELEAEFQRLSAECAAVEHENATLTHLQVATRLLHRTLDRKQVINSIHEILINLVGSEHLALFEVEKRQQRLVLISSFGIDAGQYAEVPLATGIVGECARSGLIHVRAAEAPPDEPAACVPLHFDGNVTGVLVLFRLLEHKLGFEDVDYALFELLSRQAAIALLSTSATGVRRWR